MLDLPLSVVVIGVAFLVAGGIKGFIGVGLPTVAMAFLSIIMAPAQAAALIVVPALATNIWQMAAGPALGALLTRFATMIAGVAVGTFATIGVLTGAPTTFVIGVLGAVLCLNGIYGLAATRFEIKPQAERWLSPLIGLLTGMVSGTTGVFLIPSVPYLSGLRLDRDELVQSIGISAFACPLILGIALAIHGQYRAELATGSFLAVLPALAGMYVGLRMARRLPASAFRRWFFAGLIVLGAVMVARSVAAAL